LGKIDAFELDFFEDSQFDVLGIWYDVLNAGLHLPLVGAGGKESNAEALGVMRTYAHLLEGADFSYASWIEAVRAGRTFVTNGPLLECTAEDHEPGATIRLDGDGVLRIRATAQSETPFERLELLVNGTTAHTVQASDESSAATLETELQPSTSAWLAVR